MLGKRDFEKAQVKNRAAAPQQITAEQILREAVDGKRSEKAAQKVTFANEAELNEYRMSKRKEFEDHLRRLRNHMGTWIKYALWEVAQQEFRRARSIFERALQVDYQNVTLWLKYIEMEISEKFIQHARNLYDRVTTLLPRVDQFWYKYAYMEERLENYAGSRSIYEKWMAWKPSDNAWLQYVKFEERCGEVDRARSVFERYLTLHQSVLAFSRYAKFEERHRQFDKARAGFETCVQLMHIDELNAEIFIKYAQFEARQGQMDKATRVYKLGIAKMGPEKSASIYTAYVVHTKQTGSRNEIEEILIAKRRVYYESAMPDLDICFDYLKMEQEGGETEKIRNLFSRCLSTAPTKKVDLKRYVYLWLFYAQFEELQGDTSPDAIRSIYESGVNQVKIVFTKLVRAFSEFELRQKNVTNFRAILKSALIHTQGRKLSIVRFWMETELKLGNVAQARAVASKLVELNPSSVDSWSMFIDLELALGEETRALAICDLALEQGHVAIVERKAQILDNCK